MNRRFALPFAFLLLCTACERKLTRDQIKEQLEKAWSEHLQQTSSAKTPNLRFNVLDVEYYEDKTFYDCQFKVKMTMPDGQDTTGIMQAKVSKDFSTVK